MSRKSYILFCLGFLVILGIVIGRSTAVAQLAQPAKPVTSITNTSLANEINYDAALEITATLPVTAYLPIVLNNFGLCSTIPTLLGPTNGSNLDNIIPLFGWDSGTDSGATAFRLEMSLDPNFSQLVASLWSGGATGIREFRFSNNFSPGTTYFWRAWLECDEIVGSYSEVWSFTTGSGGVILPAPALIAPTNGSVLTTWPVALQWSTVNGAVEYKSHWRKVGLGGSTYSWVDGTHLDLSWLEANTTYEWWVSARNDYAIGESSETWQFISPASPPTDVPQNISDGFVVIEEYDGETIITLERESR